MRFISLIVIIIFQSCGFDPSLIDPGNDPNFTVVVANQSGLKRFVKKVVVFDIPIYGVEKVHSNKMLHAANIMAQYLDNDEDGVIDNPAVYEKMLDNNAFMVMWERESDLNRINVSDDWIGQDLGNEETRPEWHNSLDGPFDASLEEVLHIITHAGYAYAYPETFGENTGTDLAKALDKARGGQFFNVPDTYPIDAWFTYDDETCDYACMNTEYLYWLLTSKLGAQSNRLDEIGQEWTLVSPSLVETFDTLGNALIIDAMYKMPTILPDGRYMQ
jgi:hypothetical protein